MLIVVVRLRVSGKRRFSLSRNNRAAVGPQFGNLEPEIFLVTEFVTVPARHALTRHFGRAVLVSVMPTSHVQLQAKLGACANRTRGSEQPARCEGYYLKGIRAAVRN